MKMMIYENLYYGLYFKAQVGIINNNSCHTKGHSRLLISINLAE